MIIEEKDFILTQQGDFDRFDLELLYVVNAKDPTKRREEFKEAGYSMTMETALNKVINYRVSKKEETLSLQKYLKMYKEERLELIKTIGLK